MLEHELVLAASPLGTRVDDDRHDASAVVESIADDERLDPFIRDGMRRGDVLVDADPARGVSALACSAGVRIVRLDLGAMGVYDGDPMQSPQERAGEPGDDAGQIDEHVVSLLEGEQLLHLHAGDAAQVAPLLARVNAYVRAGRVAAVVWRHDPVLAGGLDVSADAIAALDRCGFRHFAMHTGSEEPELIAVAPPNLSDLVFSLSDAFLDRASHVPESAEPLTEACVAADALFDAVLEDVVPGAAALGRIPTRGEIALFQLEQAWTTARAVSFDIFDTLVVRRTAAPTDVFLFLADRSPFAPLALPAEALRDARERAEIAARRHAAAAKGTLEVTLWEIHAGLAHDLGLPAELVPAMVRAEEEVELAVCIAHPTLTAWFARAGREGKPRWCISDTYHEARFLRELLTNAGYDLEGVTVVSSADRGCSKGDGRLFTEVVAEIGIPVEHLLHVGDHAISDDKVPAGMGIRTLLHPWAACRPSEQPAAATGDATALGLAMIGARTHEPPAPFWWRFGFSVAGPLLAAFSQWLHERMVADRIDRAYFLLRDGEVLHEAFRGVVGDAATVSTRLLESSRRAFSLPAWEARVRTLDAQLTASENPRPVREFLTRLGLDADAMSRDVARAGFDSLDEVVHPLDPEGGRRMQSVMQQPRVVAALRERSRVERALLLEYLTMEGVLAPGRVALVDVGWNGTIQKSLAAVLRLAQRPVPLFGYYLGSNATAHVESVGSSVAGFLFERGLPIERARVVMALPQLLEFICTTSRGSLRAFRRHEGRVQPVHGPVDHDAVQSERQQQLRMGLREYIDAFGAARRALRVGPVSADAALQRLARVITAPTAEEAEHIGEIAHGDGLGANRSRKLAAFSEGAWSLSSLHRDRQMAYWPAGLEARRDPRALVLRSVNWLLEDSRE
jgi:predicted HAD superfamily hydrolase